MYNTPIIMPLIFPVTCHTDFVGLGSTFVAIEGYADNGIKYVAAAIVKGARELVVPCDTVFDEDVLILIKEHNVVVHYVSNTRKALAELSAHKAGYPANNLKIIGITGTKGKTTTSFLLEHILCSAGYKTALISSAQNRICGNNFPAPLTTPQPDYLQQFLKLCVENGVDYVIMEVAAQALTLYRVEGIMFCGIIFTNFSHEHLEFYVTLDDYFQAKCLIFTMVAENAPILVNEDNEYIAQLLDSSTVIGNKLLAEHVGIISYGFKANQVDVRGTCSRDQSREVSIRVQYQFCDDVFICPILFGTYNAYNVLAAVSISLKLNVNTSVIQYALQTFAGVPGRLQEHILSNGARCFIDYAHNPESFTAVLSTLRLLTNHLIVLFGAGGGRDKFKRPIMGSIATQIADVVVITSDNPRLEDPNKIADDIICGVNVDMRYKIVQELDRKRAIEKACFLSHQGSIIALLGKGPDEYQIVGKTKHYFSEKSIVEQL